MTKKSIIVFVVFYQISAWFDLVWQCINNPEFDLWWHIVNAFGGNVTSYAAMKAGTRGIIGVTPIESMILEGNRTENR